MTFLDLLGEVPESPINMTAKGSSPPSVYGERKIIKEIEKEAGKKEVRNSSSSDTTAPVAPGDGI